MSLSALNVFFLSQDIWEFSSLGKAIWGTGQQCQEPDSMLGGSGNWWQRQLWYKAALQALSRKFIFLIFIFIKLYFILEWQEQKESNQLLIFFFLFNQQPQTFVCGEVLSLHKACVPLPVSAADMASYQHISFSPFLARALRGKRRILSSYLRGKQRMTGIGPPRYRGFCKSRNNVAAQDLAQARWSAAMLVPRQQPKARRRLQAPQLHPRLPHRCTFAQTAV